MVFGGWVSSHFIKKLKDSRLLIFEMTPKFHKEFGKNKKQ